jgi:hypothetical protein
MDDLAALPRPHARGSVLGLGNDFGVHAVARARAVAAPTSRTATAVHAAAARRPILAIFLALANSTHDTRELFPFYKNAAEL